ncbi:hypothetical protein J2853_007139 [Streptosporangium lutulentum]|uniref:Uncharacterized protein n=1 Tax=Streptosporangium lutulentum TaxID=1461250 RepID=A0ABT9QMD8_9ACTN|nr:hypothetical protein [Streptosporangium lutulentum]
MFPPEDSGSASLHLRASAEAACVLRPRRPASSSGSRRSAVGGRGMPGLPRPRISAEARPASSSSGSAVSGWGLGVGGQAGRDFLDGPSGRTPGTEISSRPERWACADQGGVMAKRRFRPLIRPAWPLARPTICPLARQAVRLPSPPLARLAVRPMVRLAARAGCSPVLPVCSSYSPERLPGRQTEGFYPPARRTGFANAVTGNVRRVGGTLRGFTSRE